MTSMTAGRPTQGTTSRTTLPSDDIARELVSTHTPAALAETGYLSGPDGHAVASQMREHQLDEALLLGRCSTTNDVDAFYRRDEEPDEQWHARREDTIAKYCARCPIAAACLELALRYPEAPQDLAVRGGATEEDQLALADTEAERLAAARARDRAPYEQRTMRLHAARQVLGLAQTLIGLSVKPEARNKNHAELRAAVSELKQLRSDHRRATGWAA
ncbi:WhiB family transcriptional regulator [Streptomyces sp. ID05-04B]|uniref:WhiB family transcriptional regulator n=1 Tax=Streptomyces sp. ID05-04B TaxID=3028661 RepID=UPI0029C48D47|nr:WhiB family transcriptional regulator [Streptomyces sp. ID05-04B]MDX5563316.1 WhiB family transcriptional regulator [Streptomyces sp. ID05-04B]